MGIKLLVLAMVLLQEQSDRVVIPGRPGLASLMVLGDGPNGRVLSKGLCEASGVIPFDDPPLAALNEVIGLSPENVPVLLSEWTDDVDSFNLEFKGMFPLPVVFWILAGDFTQEVRDVERLMKSGGKAWSAERMGLMFTVDRDAFRDKTKDESLERFRAIREVEIESSVWGEIEEVGFIEGHVNVYWVRSVLGVTGMGASNYDLKVIMGMDSDANLLAHEVGHGFGLGHTDGMPSFDSHNIMAESTTNRLFMAEGQIYRAHFGDKSILNSVYKRLPVSMVRVCGDDNLVCPRVEERLWADGITLLGVCP